MNIKFSVFCLFMSLALLACTRSDDQSDPNRVEIALTPVFENSARATATAFDEGDQIGLYVLRSIENEKLTATISGALESERTLYYPDSKDPASLRAYYPYNSSVTDATKLPFTVSTDLKQSDLCYAQAEALPSKEAQALPFKHILSRIVVDITLNSKINNITSVKFINAATDLTLNIETGAITLGSQTKSLAVNNSEAIIPPQTFAAGAKMLEITVETKAGITEIYYYSPLSATTLEQGKSHSFSLALRDNQTAELTSPPLIAPWTGGATTGTIDHKVSNNFIAHWALDDSRILEINRIELILKDNLTNVTSTMIINNPVYNNLSFSFDLNPVNNLHYPYTVVSMKFYKDAELIKRTFNILASNVYKSGAHTLGVKAPENAVYIDGLWWATGNLVATNTAAPNNAGLGGARIGAPTDGGLYFKFGSLVGLNGGGNGSGVGIAVNTHNTGYWLRPTGHTTSTNWANSAYFSDVSKTLADLRDYVTIDNAGGNGIGDACRYYLGSPWRTPTGREYGDLCNKQYAIQTNVGWEATGGEEVTIPAYGGWWNGTSSSTTDPLTAVYFVGSGYREGGAGALISVGFQGLYWSSSIGRAVLGLGLNFAAGGVGPQDNLGRVGGFPLRCVQ